MKTKLILGMILIATTGCTTTYIKTPSGYEFKRTSLGTNPTIGPIELTHDNTSFKMGGYNHEQSEAFKKVVAEFNALLLATR